MNKGLSYFAPILLYLDRNNDCITIIQAKVNATGAAVCKTSRLGANLPQCQHKENSNAMRVFKTIYYMFSGKNVYCDVLSNSR